jgi:adenylosuccinate lyase
MAFSSLEAISPIDGRYRGKVEELGNYFSESALIKYRVLVEIEYFIDLVKVELPALENFPKDKFDEIRSIYTSFSTEDAEKVKSIESITNHDVKAVEYFIKEKFDALSLSEWKEYIHFGLTSQDINNTATPKLLKDAIEAVYIPAIGELNELLNQYKNDWKDISMLARTHGQPASPTKLGKEIQVFTERIEIQINQLKAIPFSAWIIHLVCQGLRQRLKLSIMII